MGSVIFKSFVLHSFVTAFLHSSSIEIGRSSNLATDIPDSGKI